MPASAEDTPSEFSLLSQALGGEALKESKLSCPWCLLQFSLGMVEMRGMLLVLLYISHSSASECASFFRDDMAGESPQKSKGPLMSREAWGEEDSWCFALGSMGCGIQNTDTAATSEEGMVRSKEFPWVVSLQDSLYTHLAFGSILKPSRHVTNVRISIFSLPSSSSSFNRLLPCSLSRKDTIAIVGIAKMDAKVIFHKEYPVNTIIIHEDFDNNTMTNNIALLKTDTAIQFNDLVKPICFLGRKLHIPPTLQNCWVAGWNPTSAVNGFLLLEKALHWLRECLLVNNPWALCCLVQTGNHMTMSILRKISVKDMNLCPLRKIEKSGCGSHLEKEIDSVCLGDPGNPMMCQLQHLNVWVLRGILSPGGEECPGLFLYIRVEDYSDWITDKTKKTSPPLSSFHHWNNPIPFFNHFSEIAVTEKKYTGLSQVGLSQTFFPGQNGDTLQLWPVNNSRESPDSRAKGFRELSAAPDMAVQPMYYDYYGGEAGENGALSGQNRFHRPQEIILFFFVLVFFCSGI
ncbi:Inactive serine protease 54 [Galemys pyrenaicus]|uniref:Inactive serine protease 54 n=1 Tax=Galemys pyrenaicus TaxID=202257 RepID=A0A8J6DWB5_GALPY|nr:Inactive serine protease 54 [Galemys pyrenaicus]